MMEAVLVCKLDGSQKIQWREAVQEGNVSQAVVQTPEVPAQDQ